MKEVIPQSQNQNDVAVPDGQLELAHILFTDIVGYSKLPIDGQQRILQRLQKLVEQTKEFKQARAANQLITLPTGDGMALVFFTHPLAAVHCAVDLARKLKAAPEIRLRMGVHTGPVLRFADINRNLNVSGGGINMAQRVMDCGDAGHILLSRNVADVLLQLSEWEAHLSDWGEQKVKHDVLVHIFNLYTVDVGCAELPFKLRFIKQPSTGRRAAVLALLTFLVIGALVVTGWHFWVRRKAPQTIVDLTPTAERRLMYSLMVRPGGKGKPFQMAREMIFPPGYGVQLNVNSPQAGFLYIINEGPEEKNGLPQYNVLFPNTLTDSSSAALTAGRVIQVPQRSNNPDDDWFYFDKEQGIEKLWLIWSGKPVAELEAVKVHANPKEQGEIRDRGEIESVSKYLAAHALTKVEVEKDEANKQTILKGNGEALVGLVKLEHH